MSDIFQEVEEEVRREKYEKLWKQYGDYVIAAVTVLIVAVAGFKLWQHYHFVQTQKASAAFLQAMELSDGGKPADAAAAFAKIAKTAPRGYAETAGLAEAGNLVAVGQPHQALALYRKIIAKRSDEVGMTARIRAAWLTADSAKKSDLEELLQPLNTDKSGWRFMAREILAYVDFRDGRLDAARAAYTKLAGDAGAPDQIRARAKSMATLIHTGVGDYGTVPEPETAKSDDAGAENGKAKQ